MDALTSHASQGRWCEIHVDLVYSVYLGLIYGSAHCNMCCLPYIEQQIECHAIHLKIKGSIKAQVSEERLWYCGALCENLEIEMRQRSISSSNLFFLTWFPSLLHYKDMMYINYTSNYCSTLCSLGHTLCYPVSSLSIYALEARKALASKGNHCVTCTSQYIYWGYSRHYVKLSGSQFCRKIPNENMADLFLKVHGAITWNKKLW